MPLIQGLLAEFQHESMNTKKVLERVPAEHFDWKPHEKSSSLGGLATHITILPRWVDLIMNHDELDLLAPNFTPPNVTTLPELMQSFENQFAKAKAVLQGNITDELLMKNWTLKRGDQVFFTLPKISALRSMVYNHVIHHRAQLGVYLRLLNIPVPSIYGPTADEKFF